MNRVFAAAWEIHQFCERRSWPFCFIGGMDVQRWGEQRASDDVYLTLATVLGAEDRLADELLPIFPIAEGVLIRQWRTIDLKQVHVELQPLADLKESPEILIRLDDLVKKLSQSPVLSELRRQ